jgi:hypothetical protein
VHQADRQVALLVLIWLQRERFPEKQILFHEEDYHFHV